MGGTIYAVKESQLTVGEEGRDDPRGKRIMPLSIYDWFLDYAMTFQKCILYIFDLNGGYCGGELDKFVGEHRCGLFESIQH